MSVLLLLFLLAKTVPSQKSSGKCMVSERCFVSALRFKRILNVKIRNSESQQKRIEKHMRTLGQKRTKTESFSSCYQMVVLAGGGDTNNLLCRGDPASNLTANIRDVARDLKNCERKVSETCEMNHFRERLLDDSFSDCTDLLHKFKAEITKCSDMENVCEACSCWTGGKLKRWERRIDSCNFLKLSKVIASRMQTCKKQFSKCKKYEDASIPLIATCTHTKEQMMVQAKILKENLKLLDMAIEKTLESVSYEERQEVLREAVDCSKYISTTEELIDHMIEDPLRPVTVGKFNGILSSEKLSPCETEEERLKISLQVEMMKSTKLVIIKFLRHIQESLKSKYLFGSVLQFFKFLTDHPSE